MIAENSLRRTRRVLEVLTTATLMVMVLTSHAYGQQRNVRLRFVAPTEGAQVEGYIAYVSSTSMSYADGIDFGPVTPGSDGVSEVVIQGVDVGNDVYVVMTSYDSGGTESVFSNELPFAGLDLCLDVACDDGNVCTNDSCSNGTCSNQPDPVLDGTPCDDGDAGTIGDLCSSGTCAGTAPECLLDADCGGIDACAGGSQCVNNACVAVAPLVCDDGDACNGIETCSAGVCASGTPVTCGDGDVCNGTETCSSATGACEPATPALSCPLEAGACFDSFCDAAAGCTTLLHPDGSSCLLDAGDAGVCLSGTCIAVEPDPECVVDADCSDADACNGAEVCSAGVCGAGTPVVCGDGDVCNGTETCNSATGACDAGVALQCLDETSACRDAFCDPIDGCRVEDHPDGTACAMADGMAGMCAQGACAVLDMPLDQCVDVDFAAYDVHQRWADDITTERVIAWRAPARADGMTIQYKRSHARYFNRSASGVLVATEGCVGEYEATLTGLMPGAPYHFRVAGTNKDKGGSVWSPLHKFVTASNGKRGYFKTTKVGFVAGNSPTGEMTTTVISRMREKKPTFAITIADQADFDASIAGGLAIDADAAIATHHAINRRLIDRSMIAPLITNDGPAVTPTLASETSYFDAAGQGPHGSSVQRVEGAAFVTVQSPAAGTYDPATPAGQANLGWIGSTLAALRADVSVKWIVLTLPYDLFSSEVGGPTNDAERKAMFGLTTFYRVDLVLSGHAASFERTHALSGTYENPTVTRAENKWIRGKSGTVFARIGTGGRTDFGSFEARDAPAWSAARNNTLSTFAILRVRGSESLSLQIVAIPVKRARTFTLDVIAFE